MKQPTWQFSTMPLVINVLYGSVTEKYSSALMNWRLVLQAAGLSVVSLAAAATDFGIVSLCPVRNFVLELPKKEIGPTGKKKTNDSSLQSDQLPWIFGLTLMCVSR